jgi:hypothetical protein
MPAFLTAGFLSSSARSRRRLNGLSLSQDDARLTTVRFPICSTRGVWPYSFASTSINLSGIGLTVNLPCGRLPSSQSATRLAEIFFRYVVGDRLANGFQISDVDLVEVLDA